MFLKTSDSEKVPHSKSSFSRLITLSNEKYEKTTLRESLYLAVVEVT